MNKRYYAATLIGDEPKTIYKVFAFRYPSQRNQWVKEKGIYPRVSISSKIAKKHFCYEVEFQNVNRKWDWVYEGIRSYWLAI